MGPQFLLRFLTEDMEFTLTEYQVNRIKRGCSTVPVNETAVRTAMGISKRTNVTREIYCLQDASEWIDGKVPATTQSVRGPKARLDSTYLRYLCLRMPKPVPVGAFSQDYCFLHVLYDNVGIMFLDKVGNSLYLYRNDVLY
jgi:hypothetical protein